VVAIGLALEPPCVGGQSLAPGADVLSQPPEHNVHFGRWGELLLRLSRMLLLLLLVFVVVALRLC